MQFPLLKKNVVENPKWPKCFLSIWIPTGQANGSRDGTHLWERIRIIIRPITLNKKKNLKIPAAEKPCFWPL